MIDHPVVLATFEEFRPVKTRKSVQIICEIPEERADEALRALGGFPQSGYSIWVGIVRVDETVATAPAEPADAQTPPEAPKVANDPERPPGGPLARRAGILCKQAGFQDTMAAMGRARNMACSAESTEEDAAAEMLRRLCGLNKSRAELDHNPEAARIFKQIERDYRRSQHGQSDKDMERMRR